MWVCAMRRDNLSNQRTDLVHSIYKLFGSFWKAWESLSSKYVCIIVIKHDCVHKQQHPPPKARSDAQVIYIYEHYNLVASPSFLSDI